MVKLKWIGLALGIGLFVGNGVARAADAEVIGLRNAVRDLRKELDAYKEKLDKLEESSVPAVEAAEPADAKKSWFEYVKFGGDLRYRHEIIDQQGSDTRHRQRIRARLNVEAKPQDDLKIGFRLATGSADPVSTNQSLDGGFSSKTVWFDRAYFKYSPEALNGVTIIGGKMGVPFFKAGGNQLLWDDDLSPEGLAFDYGRKLQFSDLFVKGGLLWVDERSSAADSLLYAGQLGIIRHITDTASVTFGGSYFYYAKTKGAATFYDSSDSFGNSVDGSGLYTQDYHVAEGFAQLDCQLDTLPVAVYGDYIKNLAADSNDTGYLFGVAIKPGAWKVAYSYRRIEKDATIAAFNFSDFAGGGTDGTGHVVSVGYKVSKYVSVGATQFVNQKGIDNSIDYNRTQLDFSVKF